MNIERMLGQMLCGVAENIPSVTFKCVTPTSITDYNTNTNPYPGDTTLLVIPRDSAVDIIESMHPDAHALLYSLYGEYNAFAIIGSVVKPECVLCWFNRDT